MGSFSVVHWLIVCVFIYVAFFDWHWIYDWVLIRRFVAKSKFRRWHISPLSKWYTSERTIWRAAKTASTESLFWAIRLPDHTQRSKRILIEEANNRNITIKQIENWLPITDNISSPRNNAVQLNHNASILKLARRRIMMIYARSLAYIAALFIPIIFAKNLNLDSIVYWNPVLDYLYLMSTIIVGTIVIISTVFAFLDGKTRPNIILLRPFGAPNLSRPLRRFVPNYLGPFGSTYTLSDKGYKPFILTTIFERLAGIGQYVVGFFLKPSRRAGIIKDERTFLNLARRISRSRRPSFTSFLSGDQAFNVTATNDMWKIVVDMMLHSAEIVVMDITQIGAGSEWEIRLMEERGLIHNCVFISQNSKELDARHLLVLMGINPKRLHLYDERGIVENQSYFYDQLVAAIKHEVLT